MEMQGEWIRAGGKSREGEWNKSATDHIEETEHMNSDGGESLRIYLSVGVDEPR